MATRKSGEHPGNVHDIDFEPAEFDMFFRAPLDFEMAMYPTDIEPSKQRNHKYRLKQRIEPTVGRALLFGWWG